MISVIIVTRNRSDALETISLPSLAKQDFKEFEVIIWDGSDKDDSKKVVEEFSKKNSSINIKWYKELRKGITSSRNDAIKVAKGNIVFFMDDDSEVSPDGLSVLSEAFKDKSVFGVGLPLKNIEKEKFNFMKEIYKIYATIFRLAHIGKNRKVMLSGWNIYPWPRYNDSFGEVKWLSGCSMAYRKDLFDEFSFDEKLQKFGGYALAEDIQFSHRILKNKKKLFITENGFVIHHKIKGARLAKAERGVAARIYDHFWVWRTVIYPYNKLSLFVYLWSLFGEIISLYLECILKKDSNGIKGVSKGVLMGLHAIMNEVFGKK